MKIRGAIFDCDGTLTDSMYIWSQCGSIYLRYKGLEPPETIDESFLDFDLDKAVALVDRLYGIKTTPFDILTDMFNACAEEYKNVKLLPGVRDTLEYFKDREIRMTVATGTADYIIRPNLDRLGVLSYFDAVYSAYEERTSKQFPDLFDKAAAAMGCERGETLVFEDAYYAAKTAHEAGYIVVGIRNDKEMHAAELKDVSDYYLDRTEEIIPVLEEIL